MATASPSWRWRWNRPRSRSAPPPRRFPICAIAIADAPAARSFGDILAVPTLFLFDRAGKTARILYGAPPDLHQQMEGSLKRVLQ